MKVLVGCEESQTVCRAFRIRGHVAYSCDLKPTRGRPEWHLHGDVMEAVEAADWDLIILHPDCTYMAYSGNGYYGPGKPLEYKRREALEWTLKLWDKAKQHGRRVALENPKSIIFDYLRQMQYIDPTQFGHYETKKTGLALHNLPWLKPTDRRTALFQRIDDMPPSEHRKRDRSVTFQGIADAMADQWGVLDDAEAAP